MNLLGFFVIKIKDEFSNLFVKSKKFDMGVICSQELFSKSEEKTER